MMKTADPRERNDLCSVSWVVFNGTPTGSILAEPIMSSVQMVIANILPNQPTQVLFVQRNHMVQQLPAAASDPSFRHSVLPGRFSARALGLQANGAQHAQNLGVELCVPIQDHVSAWSRVRESFTQLLDDPVRIRVSGHVEMQNPAPCMLYDEKTVQHAEAHRRHSEEIHRNDGLAVVPQKSQPALSGISAPLDRAQVPRHGSFRDQEAEFQQLPVDLGCAPGWILACHPADESRI